ncbi:uncharacterized protein [Haliotis asinina]|uniref:uncharacterized protein n=1 Tax=Haliotis asinina TaxID=109174 RepID=UPI0035318C92
MRANRTINLCYGNVKNAYKSMSKAPLGASDHNSIFLPPKYIQKLKTGKTTKKIIRTWTEDSLEQLKGCFECTNWAVFLENAENIDDLVDTVTSYINFCVDLVIPVKEIKTYPNNKPWVSKELKKLLNEKKTAFEENDKVRVKNVQKDINWKVYQCKNDFKNKVESQFKQNDLRQVWQAVKKMIGCNSTKQLICGDDDKTFASDLNSFYSRFDCHDFSEETNNILNQLPQQGNDIIISERDVTCLRKINIRKSAGPDKVDSIVLKECRDQLANIICTLFQRSMDNHCIPKMWKLSEIIPMPKKSKPSCLNDYRPVALTSVLMKCFERIVLSFLLSDVSHKLDPLQYGYQPRRGVEDATLSLLHRVYEHLEKPRSYVRILFVDFSSAFNTMQQNILLQKLLDLSVNISIIRWISSFLSQRTQRVKVNNVLSDVTPSTLAPHKVVYSPQYCSFCTPTTAGALQITVLIKYIR